MNKAVSADCTDENRAETLARIWSDYTKRASEFAVYPDRGRSVYPYLGLFEEAGEVLGQVKRILRDDNGELTDERRQKIAGELGDFCWYLSEVASGHSFSLVDLFGGEKFWPLVEEHLNAGTYADSAIGFQTSVSGFNIALTDPAYAARAAYGLIGVTIGVCARFGLRFDDVLNGNIAKLESRKLRGKISGSGSDR